MEIIKINIANKRPTVDGRPVIVCHNNYQIQFTFDEEWDEAAEKTARFIWRRDGKLRHQDVPITDNTVEIPILSKVHCVHVGVYTTDMHTTTPAKIECEYSVLCHSGETSPGLPPNNTGSDGFSPIAKVTQTADGATIEITDKDGTTTAVITNGKNGKDGYTPVKGVDYFDGKDGENGYTPIKGTDYYTEADKAEMVQAVLEALPVAEEVGF